MKSAILGIVLVATSLVLRLYHHAPAVPGIDSYAYLQGALALYPNLTFAVFVGIALTLLSVFLTRKLAVRLNLHDLTWIFSLSPYFIYTSIFATTSTLAQPLILGILLAYFSGYGMLLYFLAFLLGWLGIAHTVVALLMLILFKKKPWIVVPSLLYYLAHPAFVRTRGLLVEFGSPVGLSSFAVLLALVGVVLAWKYKTKYYWIFLSTFLVLVTSIWEQTLLVYSNIVICLLVASAFSGIRKARWELRDVKHFFLILLFCGLLFSDISYATTVGRMAPDQQMQDALRFLRIQAPHGAVVFSSPKNGYWIGYFSKLTPYATTRQVRDSPYFLATSNLDELIFFMSRNEITYVVLTRDMVTDSWDGPERGMPYLVQNKDIFDRIYENPSVRIYHFRGKR